MKKIVWCAAMVLAMMAVKAQAQDNAIATKRTAYYKAYGEQDSAKAIVLAKQFLKDYPMDKTDVEADAKANVQYYRIYQKLLTIPAKEMNKNVATYINELPFLSLVDFYYHSISLYLLHKIEAPASLLERSEIIIKRMPAFKTAPREYANLSKAEWDLKYERAYRDMIFTHTSLLHAVGRNAEALPFAEELNAFFKYKNASLNQEHIDILLALKKKREAHTVLENSVRNNQATPAMLDMLKANYVAKYKTEEGFDKYRETLRDEDVEAAMKEELKKEFIKKDLPAFTLYDVNGNKVSSADWKGKIVVLDFWASWCAPCKAAFPGMKMAQDRLSEQKDVAFYFIVVHEHKKGYKDDINKFIKDNNYPFTVLFDGFDDAKSSDEAAKQLNVTAIPHKMILDKEGKLRFSVISYMGSPSRLADEIVMMVNMTRE
ncbi:TlpA family protein disulfide reductase [Chitinophaga horti]|uniref:TlpA family protein disulfide reductase n=1 Tax=Chitinophaga horti TaxID=2920382 RepID=A0ABY6JA94_9BACT|nr:TlpA disulfide reductase family protein [Chitinophaga horti]UYQ95482.1 TlpA family protein disulfide reductase [Chitinophaga horti]